MAMRAFNIDEPGGIQNQTGGGRGQGTRPKKKKKGENRETFFFFYRSYQQRISV